MNFEIGISLDILRIELNDKVVTDMKNLCEFFENYSLTQLIKQYRPRTKPIVGDSFGNSRKEQKKRKMIARDWWQFVIWANRMKKIKNSQNVPRYFKFLQGNC
jgi:hypothetical protein